MCVSVYILIHLSTFDCIQNTRLYFIQLNPGTFTSMVSQIPISGVLAHNVYVYYDLKGERVIK